MFDRASSRAKAVASEIRAKRPEIAAAEKSLGSRLTIAQNVMRLRIQRGYTQKQLAELLTVRQPRIAEIESARANLQVETLDRIAAVFGVETSTLLKVDKKSRHSVAVTKPVQPVNPRYERPGNWGSPARTYAAAEGMKNG
jgi:transcriptional regulator with XRE-family HTH domain